MWGGVLSFFVVFPFVMQALGSEQEDFVLLDGRTGKLLHEQGLGVDLHTTPACSFNIALVEELDWKVTVARVQELIARLLEG